MNQEEIKRCITDWLSREEGIADIRRMINRELPAEVDPLIITLKKKFPDRRNP